MRKLLQRREAVPAILIVVAFIAGVIESPYFLDLKYLLASSALYAETGLLALGMTFVVITGEIDLSVASGMALVACLTAKLMTAHCPWPLAILAGVLIGALLGLLNGALVAYLRLPSFLVTLASLASYRGVAQVLLGSSSISLPPQVSKLGAATLVGIPLSSIGLVVVAVLFGLLLHRTVFGRWIYSVGTNDLAARYSGVPASQVKMLAFVLSGAMYGLAGFLINARLGVARFDDAQGLELDVVTVVVLGGTSISGGSGTILGSMLALVLIGLLRTGMALANVTAEYQLAAVGLLLVVSVAATNQVAARGVRSKPSS